MPPRLVVAGTGGDSGKTLATLALLEAFRQKGLRPCAFKKGPDFIDAAWLGWAAGRPARNLDTYMMGPAGVTASFRDGSSGAGICLVEGNRGLLDGMDAVGTHSTATLAALLGAPVLLVVGVAKVTRTAAAWVEGCRRLAPEVLIAGVVLNRVAGKRHSSIARQAIEALGVRVVGEIPRLEGDNPLPDRHLGLVTPEEHGKLEAVRLTLAGIAGSYLDVGAIDSIAREALEPWPCQERQAGVGEVAATCTGKGAGHGAAVRIGVVMDTAFTFYYPDNIEALERAGGVIVPVSAISDGRLPQVDALVVGGGFPETHATALGRNSELLGDVRRAAGEGLPVYAECGGLMWLARAIRASGERHPMAGVLPFEVEMHERPQGHGYARAVVDAPNPFFDEGTELTGHEFHYSSVLLDDGASQGTAYRVERGSGCLPGRDGATCNNVLASYIHLHARGCPSWAPGIVRAARRFGERAKQEQ